MIDSIHLVLPLLASLLFAVGIVFTKRATALGSSTWMVVFVANFWGALLFSPLWLSEEKALPLNLLWQPLIVGVLYILGQACTFLALKYGDVSVAAPILSTKIICVPFLLTLIAGLRVEWDIWISVTMAMLGIMLVQRSDEPGSKKRLLLSVAAALGAAVTFALFDVLVQLWSGPWGAGHFLPLVFWTGAVLSLVFLPMIERERWRVSPMYGPLLIGTFCIGMQAICIVTCLAYFGDAARVNVVYALRGLWGVVLAWMLAKRFDMQEQHLSRKVLLERLGGAMLLTLAVILILVSRS